MTFLKYKWPEIELAYVRGIEKDGKIVWPNKGELAEMHDCDADYLREKARIGKWDDKRQAYLLRLEMNENEIDIPDPKKELKQFNNKCYQASTDALDVVYRKIKSQSKAPDIHELTSLVKVLERIQTIGQSSLNIQSDEYEKGKSDFEKLMEMLNKDEKKAKEKTSNETSEIEVINLGFET